MTRLHLWHEIAVQSGNLSFALIFEDDECIMPNFLGNLKQLLYDSLQLPPFDYLNLNTLRPWPADLTSGTIKLHPFHQRGDTLSASVLPKSRRKVLPVWAGTVLINVPS